jgi:hypothetical protein
MISRAVEETPARRSAGPGSPPDWASSACERSGPGRQPRRAQPIEKPASVLVHLQTHSCEPARSLVRHGRGPGPVPDRGLAVAYGRGLGARAGRPAVAGHPGGRRLGPSWSVRSTTGVDQKAQSIPAFGFRPLPALPDFPRNIGAPPASKSWKGTSFPRERSRGLGPVLVASTISNPAPRAVHRVSCET